MNISINYILVKDCTDEQFKTMMQVEVSGECRVCPNFANCLHKVFEEGLHGVDDQMDHCYKSQEDELENFSTEASEEDVKKRQDEIEAGEMARKFILKDKTKYINQGEALIVPIIKEGDKGVLLHIGGEGSLIDREGIGVPVVLKDVANEVTEEMKKEAESHGEGNRGIRKGSS